MQARRAGGRGWEAGAGGRPARPFLGPRQTPACASEGLLVDSILSSFRLLLEASRERALGWVRGALSEASGPAAARGQVGRDWVGRL